jgi:isopenicillin N synthase-like dioxygenase
MQSIPVIDIAPLLQSGPNEVGEQIARTCRDIGFMCITGTGVDPALAPAIRAQMAQLFALPHERKLAQVITRKNYRGFVPLGFFSPNDGSGKPDRYESWKLHFEVAADDPIRQDCPLYGPNIWPAELPLLPGLIQRYWHSMDSVFARLMACFCTDLRIDPQTLQSAFEKPLTSMSLLHYPPQANGDDGYGIHPHKDTDALTIIAPDPVGGLQVLARDGTWIDVECPADGFVVNIGDMLELWSGGRFVSTPHRVINRSGKERYSFPWFAVPRHDVVVRPLVDPLPGFSRPAVHCGHWSAEIWRTNWPDDKANADGLDLGTVHS